MSPGKYPPEIAYERGIFVRKNYDGSHPNKRGSLGGNWVGSLLSPSGARKALRGEARKTVKSEVEREIAKVFGFFGGEKVNEPDNAKEMQLLGGQEEGRLVPQGKSKTRYQTKGFGEAVGD